MDGKIIIYSTDVHHNIGRAKLGVAAAADALGVECDLRLSSAWIIFIGHRDRATFLEFAREEANA